MTLESLKDKTLRGIHDLKKDIAETCAAQEAKVHQLKVVAQTGGLGGLLNTILHPSPAPEGKIKNGTFTNWGGNQSFKPTEILNPETLEDLVDIVHKAQKTGKKIRCAGSGHTWSSSSVTDGYLVVMNKMQKVFEPVFDSEKGWTVELETGVLVSDLDNALRRHNPPLALPSNVVLDSVRYGGILSLGCHGAGTYTRTLPDLVSEVKIVDATGTLNTFTPEKNPEEFSAACVNLGLLGLIYTYTMRVEPMFKMHMTDTYPPLSDYFASSELSGPKLKAMVLANDSTEIFYWPFNTAGLGRANDHLWIKQWQRTKDLPVTVSPSKEGFTKLWQGYETEFGEHLYEHMATHPSSAPFVNCLLFQAIGGKDAEVVLEAPDAIHYQAGIDNLPCVDMEMALKVNEDFSNVVVAWNFVIDQLYEYAKRGEFPLNLTLEMRFVKASSLLMSAAYDEDPEAIYCMMEILSVKNTKGFDEFASMIAKFWMDQFNARPHWAKMWEYVPGIVPYLRKQSGDRYNRFETVRRKYDPSGMFMNATFAGILGH